MSRPIHGHVPSTWRIVQLGEVAETRLGKTINPRTRRGRRQRPYLRNANVQWDQVDLGDIATMHFSEAESAKYDLKAGDLLVCEGGIVGRAAIWDGAIPECHFQNALHRVRPKNGDVSAKWLLENLRWLSATGRMAAAAQGVTIQHLSQEQLRALPMVLPPRTIQDRLLERIVQARQRGESVASRLDRVRSVLIKFRQSVLGAACTGRLTADWRAERGRGSETTVADGLPRDWHYVRLDAITKTIRGGSTEVPTNQNSGWPILRSSSVRPFIIDFADVRYLSPSQSGREDFFITEGDLLITRLSGSIEYVGNCALVRGLRGRSIQFPDRLFQCQLIRPAETPYLELVFAAPQMRQQIEAASRSAAGHQRISISDLKGFTFPRPPLDEQDEIVRRVNVMLAGAAAFDMHVTRVDSGLDLAIRNILAHAFTNHSATDE